MLLFQTPMTFNSPLAKGNQTQCLYCKQTHKRITIPRVAFVSSHKRQHAHKNDTAVLFEYLSVPALFWHCTQGYKREFKLLSTSEPSVKSVWNVVRRLSLWDEGKNASWFCHFMCEENNGTMKSRSHSSFQTGIFWQPISTSFNGIQERQHEMNRMDIKEWLKKPTHTHTNELPSNNVLLHRTQLHLIELNFI